MEDRVEATLDLTGCQYLGELHQRIKIALGFPDHYGANWSAFWDCLTDMVDDPIHIEIIGIERLQSKYNEDANIMLKILKRLKHYNDDKYKNQVNIEIVIGDARHEIY